MYGPVEKLKANRPLTVCLGICLICLIPTDGQSQLSAARTDAGRQAQYLMQHGKPKEAREILRNAVLRDPNSVSAWMLLASANSQLGMEVEAINAYKQVLALQPNTPGALYNLGILHLHGNRLHEAADYLALFRQQRPQDEEAALALVHCLLALGRTSDGVRVLNQALQAPPPSAEFHLKAGKLLVKQGLAKEALQPLELALRAAPDSSDARFTLALAESRLGHHARTVELLSKPSIPKDPTHAILLGSSLTQLEKFDEAVACMEQALRLHPGEKALYLNLALAYEKSGQTGRTLKPLQQARSRWPADPEIRSKLAHQTFLAGEPAAAERLLTATSQEWNEDDLDLLVRCYVALNRLEEAQRVAERSLAKHGAREPALLALANVLQLQEKDPVVIELLEQHRPQFSTSSRYLFTLGLSHHNMGSYSQSRDFFQKAISLDPSLAQAHYLMGSSLASLGNLEEALPCYETALRLGPDRFLYHFQLGLVLSKLGRKEEAEKYLLSSIELNESHAPARFELASIYFDSSRFESARLHLQKAIEANPDFESSYYLISRVFSSLGRSQEAAVMLKQFQEIQQQRHEQGRALKQPNFRGTQP
ncbi:MAG: tetratricopeptide repeat protein [Acidobacteria bacterium]|nr:tetratricopeptide repeat protein [Acidobacteriota bacterium]